MCRNAHAACISRAGCRNGSTTIHKHNNRVSMLAVDRFSCLHTVDAVALSMCFCTIVVAFQIYAKYTGTYIYIYSCYRICGMAPKNFPPNAKHQSHIRSIPYPTNPHQFQGSHQIMLHYILRLCANDEHRLCARVPASSNIVALCISVSGAHNIPSFLRFSLQKFVAKV